MSRITAPEALRADLRAEQAASGLRGDYEPAGLREALTVRLAWMGPDVRQAVDDVIEELEAGR